MSLNLFNAPPAGTPAWHKWRAQGVGASEWTSVCPELDTSWGCQRRLMYEKTGTPETEPQIDNGPMRRGRFMEPLIREVLAERWGYQVYTVEQMRADFAHVLQPLGGLPEWWLGTPDAFIFDQTTERWGVAELKCPNPYYFRILRQEGLPTGWVIQPQHYLHTFPACTFGVVCMMEPVDLDAERVVFDVDPKLISTLKARGAEFWETRKADTGEPREIGCDTCRTCPFQSRCYRSRGLMSEAGGYIAAKGRALPASATPQVEDAYLRWSRAGLEKKAAEAELEMAKAQLVGLLGESCTVEIPDQQVKLVTKRGASKRFSTERFKRDHPQVYEAYRSLSIGEIGVREVVTGEMEE